MTEFKTELDVKLTIWLPSRLTIWVWFSDS